MKFSRLRAAPNSFRDGQDFHAKTPHPPSYYVRGGMG